MAISESPVFGLKKHVIPRWPLGIKCSTNGLLPSSLFGECMGMNKYSKDFAYELFHALARRHNINGDSINKRQLKMFLDQIFDESFDSRLQTFFDMVDKDVDGKITEEQVREIISLSASANSRTVMAI